MNVNTAILIPWVLFAALGIGVLAYSHKLASLKLMFIGVMLIIYPCFVADVVLIWLIGGMLSASLFVFWEY